ncbi:MAG: mercury resistance system periplasmic binding protein MerP [Gammaproteobacteria bacterium]|jgi:mercuric ion binding protein|nr:mercury resistance system periplasmic binding protein MerP [Gammaproteobacteria bacterium]
MKKVFATLALLAFATAAVPVWAAPQTVTLDVPGMTCPACPFTVKKALSRVDGVEKVEVSLKQREAVVTFDNTVTSPQALAEATTNAGYAATIKH